MDQNLFTFRVCIVHITMIFYTEDIAITLTRIVIHNICDCNVGSEVPFFTQYMILEFGQFDHVG